MEADLITYQSGKKEFEAVRYTGDPNGPITLVFHAWRG